MQQYPALSRLLHWLTAFLIIGMFATVWIAEDAPEWLDHTLVNMHKSFGIVILAITALRILWRVTAVRVAPAGDNALQRKAAASVHGLLYVALVAMPLSGWAFVSAFGKHIKFFNLVELPAIISTNIPLGKALREAHGFGADIVLILVGAHFAAALYHQFIRKDNLISRMLP